MARPNILLIITHDSGRHFGCYGADVDTPNIDRLARQGVRFENAFCTAPQCSPARGSLLTGRYPHRNGLIGLTHRGFRLTGDAPATPGSPPAVNRQPGPLPALLADHGYHTLLFGLHHESPDAHAMGYRRVVSQQDRSIRAVLPEVESFLSNAPPQPFFACVGFSESHRPFDPARYPMDDPDEVIVPSWLPDEPEVRADVAQLNGTIRGIDEAVGRIDAALLQAGLADNTVLIFTTDHGIAFPGAKGTLFDPGIGVALIARLPKPGPAAGAPPVGRVVEQLVSTMDLTPTLLELAGKAVPGQPDLDGQSLLPLIASKPSAGLGQRGQPGQPGQDCVFVELTYHAAYDPMRAVRTGRYKYIRSFADRPVLFAPNCDESPTKRLLMERGLHRQPRPAEMLFDLTNDPDERRNLAGLPCCLEEGSPYVAVLADLRARLAAWMEQTADPLAAGPVPPPPGATVTPAGAMTPSDLDAGDDWRGSPAG